MVEIPIFPQPPPPLLRGLKPKIYSKYCSYKNTKNQNKTTIYTRNIFDEKTNQLTGRVPMQHNKEIEDGAIISAKRTLPYCKHAAMSNGRIQWGETSNCFVYTNKHVVKRFFAPLRGSHLSPR